MALLISKNIRYRFGTIEDFLEAVKWSVDVTDLVFNKDYGGGALFNDTSFDQPIGGWDMRGVKYGTLMFFGAEAFNQPLNGWDVSSIRRVYTMFGRTSYNLPLTQWKLKVHTSRSNFIRFSSLTPENLPAEYICIGSENELQ